MAIRETDQSGWIKLYRSIQKHWIFENELYLKAWITMLLEMNHTEHKSIIEGEIIVCSRGQKVYSLSTWAKVFGSKWSVKKVRTFFNLLEKDKMIDREGLRKTTRVTIINYDSYQDKGQAKGKEKASRGQQLKNDKNVKNIKDGFLYSNSPLTYLTEAEILKEGTHPKHNTILKLLQFISENLSYVTKLEKQLSYIEAGKVLDTFTPNAIADKLKEMENWKPLIKKTSVYLTLLNWLKKDQK